MEGQRRSHAALRNANALEKQLERDCTNILIQDGWRPLKTDPVSRKAWGKGFGEPGMGDMLFMRPMKSPEPASCQVLWVEMKTPTGKLEDHQRRWHEAERAKGFTTWIMGTDFPATVEDFQKRYQSSGLFRRAGIR